MSGINNGPKFQDFARFAQQCDIAHREITLGNPDKGESVLQSRGRFVSRLVEFFRPSLARAQHQASAEAFVAAVEEQLSHAHAEGSVFHNVEIMSPDRKASVLASLRDQLATQLAGQSRLTGSDINAALQWLSSDIPAQIHAEGIEAIEEALDHLEAGSEEADAASIRKAIDHFDEARPLTADDKEAIEGFVQLYQAAKEAIGELYHPEYGTYTALKATMISTKQEATSAGRTDEAAGWGECLQWFNGKQRDLTSRLTELAGVNHKATLMLQTIDAPQMTHPPLQSIPNKENQGRGILKTRDPAHKDTTNAQSHEIRDLSKARELLDLKGVKQVKLGSEVVWYKSSDRPINAANKCIAMGILESSKATEATEADAGLANRELAASRIAKLLIPSMAVKAEFASYGGTQGIAMADAPGSMATSHVSMDGEFRLSKKVYESAKERLSDLQAFDYLIGNVDRHVENYKLEKQGRTYHPYAIDNDLSFPTVSVDKLAEVPESKFGGFPKGYSSQLREGLTRLGPEQLEIEIKPLIGTKAFVQLLDRFERLCADVRSNKHGPAEPSSEHLLGFPTFRAA